MTKILSQGAAFATAGVIAIFGVAVWWLAIWGAIYSMFEDAWAPIHMDTIFLTGFATFFTVIWLEAWPSIKAIFRDIWAGWPEDVS